MKHIAINASIALTISVLLMLVAGLISWGSYSPNSVHYIVMLVAIPLVIAAKLGLPETSGLGFAFIVYFVASLSVISWFRRDRK